MEYYTTSNGIPLLIASAAPYEKLLRELIQRLKYHDDRLIATDLASLMNNALMLLREEFPLESSILVPIPLSFWREFRRGFNQAALLAELISKRHSLALNKKALRRRKNTKAQHSLSKAERIKNLSGAFTANQKLLHEKQVILVDDVFTSGTTINEAAQVIMNAGATKVAAITVARA